MANRINSNASKTNAAEDRQLETRNKAVQKKSTKAAFQSKLTAQKQTTKSAKQFEASRQFEADNNSKTAEEAKKSEETSKDAEAKSPEQAKEKKTEGSKHKKSVNKDDDAKGTDAKSKEAKKEHKDVANDAVQRKSQEQSQEDLGGQASDDFFQQSVRLAAQAQPQQVTKTEQAKGAQQIPEEVMNQMVNQVYVGVNQKGLQQFTVELKSGIFGGGQINVTSNGKQIDVKFSGLNDEGKKLISNSKSELTARLKSKNLDLNNFSII